MIDIAHADRLRTLREAGQHLHAGNIVVDLRLTTTGHDDGEDMPPYDGPYEACGMDIHRLASVELDPDAEMQWNHRRPLGQPVEQDQAAMLGTSRRWT